MGTFVVRLWLPDRPGALGAVASRIGAVRGDLIGIDILEQGGGRAIDELVVALPDDDLVPLLLAEMSEVDGVDVEDIRPLRDGVHDARLDALETAAVLVEQGTPEAVLDALIAHAARDFESDWAAIIGGEIPVPVRCIGEVPPVAWLHAFVAGSRAAIEDGAHARVGSSRTELGISDHGPDDVAWAALDEAGLALVLGRERRPWRARERRQLSALSRIADYRWMEPVTRIARMVHPSAS